MVFSKVSIADGKTVVKFFCPECGKEMWELVDREEAWDNVRQYTLSQLRILLICSDCLLEEIRAGRTTVEVRK